MLTPKFKPGYRVPTCSVDADVRLDEFCDSDIAEYLRHRGYYVSNTSAAPHGHQPAPSAVLDPDDLNHIETLALCGQRSAAQSEALALVGNAIGRPLQ